MCVREEGYRTGKRESVKGKEKEKWEGRREVEKEYISVHILCVYSIALDSIKHPDIESIIFFM